MGDSGFQDRLEDRCGGFVETLISGINQELPVRMELTAYVENVPRCGI